MIFIYNIEYKLSIMTESILLTEYKNSRIFNSNQYIRQNNHPKSAIILNNWFIEIDKENKPLKKYQKDMLKSLYNIFDYARNTNQSGAIYVNYCIQPTLNEIRQFCSIFYCCTRGYEGFYHINLSTYKIRQINKIEEPSRTSHRKRTTTNRYSPL